MPEPTTLLCITSYEKGQDFLREAAAVGARVVLLTVHELRDAPWPPGTVEEVLSLPTLDERGAVLRFVSGLAWRLPIHAVVALDEFDMETAASVREHLRVPGMGETTARRFRDKLAMRIDAAEAGLTVPDFSPLLVRERVAAFAGRVPPPWLLKPRASASTMGIRKLEDAAELWRTVDELGEERAFHLLEGFVEGEVYHVDSIVAGREVVFAEAHRYATPPLEVYHGGGVFCTRTVERGFGPEAELLELNRQVARTLGMVRGPLHTEFIRGRDGRFHFLETAARVGGAHIADVVEAATGVNPWRAWARLEVAYTRGEAYRVPESRRGYGALLVTLARQEWPDTSAYDAPEIHLRVRKRHHAGLVLSSPDPDRLDALLREYVPRFREEFHATLPPAPSPR